MLLQCAETFLDKISEIQKMMMITEHQFCKDAKMLQGKIAFESQ